MKEDSLVLKILPELKKLFPQIKFETVDPNENFPPKGEENLIILDTVMGIKKPMILDLDDFNKKKKTPITPHDYDLLFHLLFLKKMKKIEKVIILGIPFNRKRGEIVKFIATLLLKNERRKTYMGQRRE